jgi:hypothetical protein
MRMTNKQWFAAVLAGALAETGFWLYTFYYIDHRTNLQGDGLEWIAEVPMTMIVLFGVVPALLIVIAGWWFPIASKIAALFVAGALIADVIIWSQIVQEFAHKPVH